MVPKDKSRTYFQENEEATDDISVARDTDVSITSTSSARAASWCGHQIHSQELISQESHYTSKSNYDSNTEILLDTGSTFSIFCSKELSSNIQGAM